MSPEMNYILMRFDGLDLAFPHRDVLAVESFSRIRLSEMEEDAAVGVLAFQDQELPVYMLSRELDLIDRRQQMHRFCVCLKTADRSQCYALACDAVEQHSLSEGAAVLELPEYMRIMRSPLHSMFRVGDSLALVCSAESMREFVAGGGRTDG